MPCLWSWNHMPCNLCWKPLYKGLMYTDSLLCRALYWVSSKNGMALDITESQICATGAVVGILLEIILICFTWEVELYLQFPRSSFFHGPQWYVTCILVLVNLICIQGLAKLP